MYSKCGMVPEAMEVLKNFPDRDLMAYNNLLLACRDGYPFEAVELYKQMIKDRIKPDEWTMTHILKICGYYRLMDFIPVIESHITKFKYDQLPSVQKSQSAMKDLLEARAQKVKSFNDSIASLKARQNLAGALEVFRTMIKSGVPPDQKTFELMLQVLNEQPSENLLEEIQKQMTYWRVGGELKSQVDFQLAVKKDINKAIALFKGSKTKTPSMWASLITELATKPQLLLEIYLFSSPEERALISPEHYASLLQACGQVGNIELAKLLHEEMNSRNALQLQNNATALVLAYLKLGNKPLALDTLKKSTNIDSSAYEAVILEHKNDVKTAFQLFNEMLGKDLKPSQTLLTYLVGSAASIRNFQIGQQLQSIIVRFGIQPEYTLAKELIRMYAACGKVPVAISLCREWDDNIIKPQNRPEVWEAVLKSCRKEDTMEVANLMSREERAWVDIHKILEERKKEGIRV